MRARVSLTTLKRVAKLEQTSSATRHVGDWPPIMYDTDEWERIAVEHQTRLVAAATEELHEPPGACAVPKETVAL